jgi:cysteine-rich repeat protein
MINSDDAIRGLNTDMAATMEYLTGVYKDIDPETASLARWLVNKWGTSSYHLVYRSLFGDLRTQPKSPQELGFATVGFNRGDNLFWSRSSWKDDAVVLRVHSRYIDVARNEGNSGIFSIYRGNEPIAIRASWSKNNPSAGSQSGIWVYDPANPDPIQNGGTWHSNDRAKGAYGPVSQSQYFHGDPRIDITDSYRMIGMAYENLYPTSLGVRKARRTIVHIPDGDRDFVVVYDYVEVPSNIKSAWSMRLAADPTISGSQFSIPGTMHTTVVSPGGHTVTWVGGPGDEMKGPPPELEWYGNGRGGSTPGYSSDPDGVAQFGRGNVYVQPEGQANSSQGPFPQVTDYLVVIEITDQTPVAVTRISDREVQFGDWRASFKPDGSYTLFPSGQPAPVCGNNIVEFNEQCDDGNTKDGDGCSS